MAGPSDLTDEFVTEMLKSRSKLVNRPVRTPNLRALGRELREVVSHNTALLEKERKEAQSRAHAREDRNSTTPKNGGSDRRERGMREQRDNGEESRRIKRHHSEGTDKEQPILSKGLAKYRLSRSPNRRARYDRSTSPGHYQYSDQSRSPQRRKKSNRSNSAEHRRRHSRSRSRERHRRHEDVEPPSGRHGRLSRSSTPPRKRRRSRSSTAESYSEGHKHRKRSRRNRTPPDNNRHRSKRDPRESSPSQDSNPKEQRTRRSDTAYRGHKNGDHDRHHNRHYREGSRSKIRHRSPTESPPHVEASIFADTKSSRKRNASFGPTASILAEVHKSKNISKVNEETFPSHGSGKPSPSSRSAVDEDRLDRRNRAYSPVARYNRNSARDDDNDLIDLDDDQRYHRRGNSNTRLSNTKHNITASSHSDSDPLEDLLGPLPPPPPAKIQPRGRGAFTASAATGTGIGAIDTHFSTSYNPSLDVQPDPDTEDDWDQALEAMRDRMRWKQQGAERLRAAGFSEEELKRWEKGGERDESDVRWAKVGEGREWDRGKVVELDGSIGVKAAWAAAGLGPGVEVVPKVDEEYGRLR